MILTPDVSVQQKETIMRKITVLVLCILSYAYVAPLKAETPEIVDARIAAETDIQTTAKRDAESDINQLFWCIGGSSLVTFSAVGGAFLGTMLGEALDNPRQSLDPATDPEGAGSFCAVISTGMIYGCLGGWGIGSAGAVYGIYKLGGTVPSERLIGKSPEYIEVYTATYKRKIGIQRAKRAAVGSAMLQGMFLVWVIRGI